MCKGDAAAAETAPQLQTATNTASQCADKPTYLKGCQCMHPLHVSLCLAPGCIRKGGGLRRCRSGPRPYVPLLSIRHR
jgi:hypothetical protein